MSNVSPTENMLQERSVHIAGDSFLYNLKEGQLLYNKVIQIKLKDCLRSQRYSIAGQSSAKTPTGIIYIDFFCFW